MKALQSPLVRALIAVGAIIILVVATYAYGNSQRHKQNTKNQTAQQSPTKPDQSNQATQSPSSGGTAGSANSGSSSSAAQPSQPQPTSTPPVAAAAPTKSKLPQTGNDSVFAVMIGGSLVVLFAANRNLKARSVLTR